MLYLVYLKILLQYTITLRSSQRLGRCGFAVVKNTFIYIEEINV